MSGSVGDDAVVLNDVSGRRRDLETVLLPATVAALLALPRRLAEARGQDDRGDDTGGTGDAATSSSGEPSAMAIASVLIRRYRSENHRPCFQFHTDDHSCTVNLWSPYLATADGRGGCEASARA